MAETQRDMGESTGDEDGRGDEHAGPGVLGQSSTDGSGRAGKGSDTSLAFWVALREGVGTDWRIRRTRFEVALAVSACGSSFH